MTADSTTDRELTTSRLIDAPCERVFQAFSDPTQLAQWWGPKGFTNTFEEFDLRPGGTWRFVMHGPDGGNYKNESFFDAVEPDRVVIRHISAPNFVLTITFSEESGKTRVGWRQLFNSAEERDRIAKFAGDANEQNLDRLEAVVARMP